MKRPFDPRWVQLVALLFYSIVAREVFHIERSHWVTLICVATAGILDFVLGRWIYKVWRMPFSGFIIGLAMSILLDSRFLGFYLLAVVSAVLSKVFIRYDGKHFYNPANFGTVIVLQLAVGLGIVSQRIIHGYIGPTLIFAGIGLFTSFYARQLAVSLSFYFGFIFFAIMRWLFFGAQPLMALGPALAPVFLLFTFHMINDPATTPRSWRWKIAFGLFIALLDATFRVAMIPYGNFYALFLASCFLPLFRQWENLSPHPAAKNTLL